MSKRASRSAAFARLKNGNTDDFDFGSDEDEFDPNDLREAMNEDDGGFIVDDDGRGYTGNYDDYIAEDKRANAREQGRRPKSRRSKKQPKPLQKPVRKIQSRAEKLRDRNRRNMSRKSTKQTGISAFLSTGTSSSSATTANASFSARPRQSQLGSKDFMASILDDLDDSDEDRPVLREDRSSRNRPSNFRPRSSARRSQQVQMNHDDQSFANENDFPVVDHDCIDQKEWETHPLPNAAIPEVSREENEENMGPPCAKKLRLDPSVAKESAQATVMCPSMMMDLDEMNNDIQQLGISPRKGSPPPMISRKNDSEIPTRPGCVTFFWLDAYEDVQHHPGSVFLFGKAVDPNPAANGALVSCCVVVRNIQRSVFFLPRRIDANDPHSDRIEVGEVAKEIAQLRQRMRINRVRMALVEKKYAFHGLGDIPERSHYVNLQYSFDDVAFSRQSSGQTFERVFGTRSNALELFILDRDLRGPSWLFVPHSVSSRKITWCKLELEAQNPKEIKKIDNVPPPPLRVLSLAIQTTLSSKKKHEVACLSCVISDNVPLEGDSGALTSVGAFTVVRKIDNAPYPYDLNEFLAREPNITTTNSERELLNLFTAKVQKWDPDVVVSHKLFDFTLDVLFHRMETLRVSQWSKLGRLRRNKMPLYNGRIRRHAVGCGRLMCCTFMSSQEFVHEKTYTLTNLVAQHLKINTHNNIDAARMNDYWLSSRDLIKVAKHCQNDAILILRLMTQLQILPLTKQLTNLCGNLWQKSLLSQRAERNEFLLLHDFVRDGYIVPEKYTKDEKLALGIIKEKQKKGKREAQYKGGMVLEPKVGLYDKFVILLDFNSLYPSIIQEYNLCFTTVPHYRTDISAEENPDAFRPDSDVEMGVLPRTIGVLLDRRYEVKKLMKKSKTEAERKKFDIRQKALKLVANSMYGCLGFENSRFYCKPIASLITSFGRQNLEMAAEAAPAVDERLRVIYGDTDSIMVYTDTASLTEARRLGLQVKKQVNKTYKKMYLELDEVFTKVLLLRKKKYATLTISENNRGTTVRGPVNELEFKTATQCASAMGYECKREVKGLDLVRRDWAVLSKEIGEEVLDIILSDESVEDVVANVHECLRTHGEAVKSNSVPLEKYIVTKKLTKHPSEYPDAKKQAHVQVAIQMQKLGIPVNVGDIIPYIICTQCRPDSQTKSLASRAYHMQEIIRSQRQSISAVSATDEKELDENAVVSKPSALEVDRLWYLENQILPPVGRYCTPIEGTDVAQLASCLGLDSRKYAQSSRNNGVADDVDGDEDEDSFLFLTGNPNEMYANCGKLKIRCAHCRIEIVFSGVLKFELDASSGFRCPTPNCRGLIDEYNDTNARRDFYRIQNAIQRSVSSYIDTYYNRVWSCRDPTCQFSTRQLPLRGAQCPRLGCSSFMLESYSANELFTQIRHFAYLFDVPRVMKIYHEEAKEKPQYQTERSGQISKVEDMAAKQVHEFIEKQILARSRYNFLSGHSLFKFFAPRR